MNPVPVDKGLKIFDIKFKVKTAGPSPNNNERIELFLSGCKKAAEGNPCKGCFNSILWNNNSIEHSWNPIDVANIIADQTKSRYITIGGGEPLDQLEHLVPLVKQLKTHGFHIILYTHKEIWYEINKANQPVWFYTNYPEQLSLHYELFRNIDIIIDGEYIQDKRIYKDEYYDGFYGSIGSSNQTIIDMHKPKKIYIDNNLKNIYIDNDNNLKITYKGAEYIE